MDAVLFDLFGTLVPNLELREYVRCVESIADRFGAPRAGFMELWRATFRDRMVGALRDGPDMFVPILAKLGIEADRTALEEANHVRHAFMAERIHPKDDAVACLEALRGRGLKLALVTDCSSGTPDVLDGTPLGAFFEVRAVSALLRTTKPDPRMYRHALDGLGVDGARCVYVGDGNSQELPGAKRHGMTTVRVDNGPSQFWKHGFVPEGDHTVTRLEDVVPIVDRLQK